MTHTCQVACAKLSRVDKTTLNYELYFHYFVLCIYIQSSASVLSLQHLTFIIRNLQNTYKTIINHPSSQLYLHMYISAFTVAVPKPLKKVHGP